MRDFFLSKISKLKQDGLYRKLEICNLKEKNVVIKEGKKLQCFASNDYLNLAHNKKVKKVAISAIKKYGASSSASRYICGNNELYEKLENEIAKFHSCENAIIFSSGYQTAIGIIPALAKKGDLIIADKLIHSCLIDGCKLSDAKLLRFKHNDILDCEKILKNDRENYQNCIIITEEIFSMDGDLGKVNEINILAKKYNCQILLDSAHSLYENNKKLPQNIIKMGTFSKALGSFGGYVCADKITIDYLRNFAKSAIYTTALPASVIASSLQALKIVSKKNLAQKALNNAKFFCDLLNLEKPESAIVILKSSGNRNIVEIAKEIAKKGFLISAIRPPTVASARLRITFCANHSKKSIKKLAQIIKNTHK